MNQRIVAVERELERRATTDRRVLRLRTHTGVGLFTGLAVVHTLEPATRFRRSRQVAAYCGLDPQEHSSGEAQRFGHISKQGNLLLRHMRLYRMLREGSSTRSSGAEVETRSVPAVAQKPIVPEV